MTKTQRKLLTDMAAGATFWAALRHPQDFERDGVVLSEAVKISVRKDGKFLRHVRAKTADPLYLNGLVEHGEGASGDREFKITAKGRAAIAH